LEVLRFKQGRLVCVVRESQSWIAEEGCYKRMTHALRHGKLTPVRVERFAFEDAGP
jgi:hypothetical protein